MTISVEERIATEIRREAARDGVDISTWVARTAHREATRRAYAEAAAERQAAGVDDGRRLEAYAARRAAVRRYLADEQGGADAT